MPPISETLRQQVTKRAHGLCEYCQTAQLIVVTLEIDHIIPESAGGATDLDNLCLCCRGCNSFKQDFQTGIDPNTDQEVALFNPRTQLWNDHFEWGEEGTMLMGKTATGSATIQRLRINRPTIIASRQLWVQAGWHPPKFGQFPTNTDENT
ncbi:MAG: HNH endonuclease [Anaerolineae bacterium]|nr:HNH endonuclease [Anaerolineae bacterium]